MNAGKAYKKTIRRVMKAERELAAKDAHSLTRDDFVALAKKSGMSAQLQMLQGRVRRPAPALVALPAGGGL